MISRIRGTLIVRAGEAIEVATPGGVVYEIEVSTRTLEQLPGAGTELDIRTVQVVREDSTALYGFLEAHERTLFRRLMGAKGVGAKLALAMMSTYTPERLARALAERDVAALQRVSGVGKKTAERLALELSDKVGDLATAGPGGTAAGPAQAAVAALVALGFDHTAADAAVRAVLAEQDVDSTDELIRLALKQD